MELPQVPSTTGGTELVRRPTVSILRLDDSKATLLFRCPTRNGGFVWFTPGGGGELGETAEQNHGRELREETGLDGVKLESEIWHRTIQQTIDGQLWEFRERWFLARMDRFAPDTSCFDPDKPNAIHEYRWWTVGDLGAQSNVWCYPTSMPFSLRFCATVRQQRASISRPRSAARLPRLVAFERSR